MATLLEVADYPKPHWEAGEASASSFDRLCRPVRPTSPQLTPRAVSDRVKPCVLIVDDDEAVRETLAELLEDSGFSCVTAKDADAALVILRQRGRIDALVTDLTMPGHDGISLIRQAREIDHGLPAILLTGYAEQAASIATIAGGKFHVLSKPVQSDRLIQEVELLIAKSHV
jgi:DNA-binding NtrC family response regulator